MIWNVLWQECKLLGYGADKLREAFASRRYSPVFEDRLTDRLYHFLSCPNSQRRIILGSVGKAINLYVKTRKVERGGQ